jgi:hypothetical protein
MTMVDRTCCQCKTISAYLSPPTSSVPSFCGYIGSERGASMLEAEPTHGYIIRTVDSLNTLSLCIKLDANLLLLILPDSADSEDEVRYCASSYKSPVQKGMSWVHLMRSTRQFRLG